MKKLILTLITGAGLFLLPNSNAQISNIPAETAFKSLTWDVNGKSFDLTPLKFNYTETLETYTSDHPDAGPYGAVHLEGRRNITPENPTGEYAGGILFGGTATTAPWNLGMQVYMNNPEGDNIYLGFTWAGEPGNYDQGLQLTTATLNGEVIDTNSITGIKSLTPSQIVANEATANFIQTYIPSIWSEFPVFVVEGDVFVEQARELNIGLQFENGQWVPAQ
jgi:hypothetical protein